MRIYVTILLRNYKTVHESRTSMNTYEAIFKRKSVRKYNMEALAPEVLEDLRQYYRAIPGLFPGMDTELVIHNNVQNPKRGGFLAPTAPYYLSFYSQEGEKNRMNAGCVMEQLSLYMTCRGIGSCYLGGRSFLKRNEEYKGQKLIMEMAFGVPQGTLTRDPSRANRIELKELCVLKEPMRSWMHHILEAARMAPSSFNSQPWRFLVSNGRIHIFSRKESGGTRGKLSDFNLGVMLGHIMTAAEELWLEVDLIRLEDISQKEFKRFDYVLSVLISQ